MALSFCLCYPPFSLKTSGKSFPTSNLTDLSLTSFRRPIVVCHNVGEGQRFIFPLGGVRIECFNKQARIGTEVKSCWSFARGSVVSHRPKLSTLIARRKSYTIHASWFTTSQLAPSVFTVGTAAVLPFYTLMVFAPKANLTKKTMESSFPYVALGLLYTYLLYLSWTPDTIRLMFSGQYLLPELPGIATMFSSEMTLASAWIHLLAVDLFAARHIFHDGLENQVETRHSVSLCLFCCPIGIFTHIITKALATTAANKTPGIQ